MPLEATCVADIAERVVAIVKFGPPLNSDGMRPGEFYQVTIDPERFSPCGEFIRVGLYPGDELVGWQRASSLYALSVLAPWPKEVESLELPWFASPALEAA